MQSPGSGPGTENEDYANVEGARPGQGTWSVFDGKDIRHPCARVVAKDEQVG